MYLSKCHSGKVLAMKQKFENVEKNHVDEDAHVLSFSSKPPVTCTSSLPLVQNTEEIKCTLSPPLKAKIKRAPAFREWTPDGKTIRELRVVPRTNLVKERIQKLEVHCKQPIVIAAVQNASVREEKKEQPANVERVIDDWNRDANKTDCKVVSARLQAIKLTDPAIYSVLKTPLPLGPPPKKPPRLRSAVASADDVELRDVASVPATASVTRTTDSSILHPLLRIIKRSNGSSLPLDLTAARAETEPSASQGKLLHSLVGCITGTQHLYEEIATPNSAFYVDLVSDAESKDAKRRNEEPIYAEPNYSFTRWNQLCQKEICHKLQEDDNYVSPYLVSAVGSNGIPYSHNECSLLLSSDTLSNPPTFSPPLQPFHF